MSNLVLELDQITKSYHSGTDKSLSVLQSASLSLHQGEICALVAPSGAGKSTLLHIAGLLDQPDTGKVILNGKETGQQTENVRTQARRCDIGFVYQFHHLLPEFSARENIELPQWANGVSQKQAKTRAAHLLDLVGLSDRAEHRPAQMSGGEQQRVAICRALANEPSLLLADEPTGNLDQNTSQQVFDVLLHIVRETGLSALIATHNPQLANRMDRIIHLENGQLA